MSASLMKHFHGIFASRNVVNNATHMIPHIRPDSRILDVGCSVGSITLDLAQRASQGEVVAIDISEEAISSAKKSSQELGIHNVTFQVGDVMDLDDDATFKPESFDIIHLHQVLLHLTEPVKAVGILYRLLKPGGILCTRDFAYCTIVGGEPILAEAMDRYYRYRMSLGADPFGGKVNHAWLAQGGFAWERIESGSAGWEVSSLEERRLWAGIMSGSITASEEFAGDEETTDKIKNAWGEWEKNEEARFMALDGWVIGRK